MNIAEFLTAEQQKLTDLVRRLEKDGYDFGVDITQIETTIKNTPADTLEKPYLRADSLDDGSLSDALAQANKRLSCVPIGVGAVSLVGAMAVVMAVVFSGIVNFYYLLVLIILINFILLIRSLVAYRHSEGKLPFDTLFDRLMPDTDTPVDRHAYAICLEERNMTHYWQSLKLIQLQWLMIGLGTIMGLIIGYLAHQESFVWQASAYHGHLKTLADILNILPQMFGSRLDNLINEPSQLLYFLSLSVFIYMVLPRAVVWAVCFVQTRAGFVLDYKLYYYDELYRKFSHKISDDDDYVPYNAKPELAHVDATLQKIVATLNQEAIDETWYRFGAGFKVYQFGVLNAENLERLFAVIDLKKKPVYLGVFMDSFPDETAQSLLTALKQRAGYGLSVEIIKVVDDDRHNYFYADWQEFLLQAGIAEVRY